MNEPFVRVPHWVQDYLMSANLNITQFKIFNAVVRYSFGYGNKWCYLALSKLSEYTKCNRRQIVRELKSMLEQGILVERTSGKQRELCINPALKHLASDSTDTTTSDSGDTDASDSTDTYIKKDIKEIYKENNTSHLHVTALFLKEYDSNIKEYIDDTLTTYYAMYLERKKEEHPKLKRDQLQRIYEWMERVILDYGDIDDMIEEFFNTVKKTDHNINHFCTDGMIQILVDRCK